MTDFSRMSDQELLAAYQAAKGGAPAPKPAKLTPQEAKQLAEARAAAQSTAAAARDGDAFLDINRQAGTGEAWAMGNFWGLPSLADARAAFDPKFAEMQSLTNRMAPMQRQAGSGAMSDKDVELFKRSVPNIEFPGPTNTAIVGRLKSEAQRAQERAAFLDDYAARNGTLIGAEAAWAARPAKPQRQPIQSRIKPDFKAMTPAQRKAAVRFRGSRSDSGTQGNPSLPVNEQQYNALPSGTYYIHPDGSVKRKP